ncbi:MAG TPA: GGDEF domain-containing protein [Acidimicrobiales bacterium]|nr:GGDEF domain-containing protein [Acidimicrobiales bacterium]
MRTADTAVKEWAGGADDSKVTPHFPQPTERGVRQGLVVGLIAESVAIPLIVAVIVFDPHTSWWYPAGALACVLVSVAYLTRAVVALSERIDFHRSVGALNDALDEVGPDDAGGDLIEGALSHGLPLVPDVMAADHVVVLARNGNPGGFVSVAAWPGVRDGAPDLAGRPELTRALDSDSTVLTPELCAIPIGRCPEGELLMVVRRTPGRQADQQAIEAAEALAAAFLRVSNRANCLAALEVEDRTDLLTGLGGRRILFERIQIEMDHAIRSESPLSVAMIDLDHFKQYNERHGSVAGDTVLRAIAALMVSNVRRQDLVVRYGGEEFFLVMPDTDILGGHHLLDKLREGGRDATSEFGVTLSAGLTSWDGVEDITSLIERADQALYRAKESGRDRVVSIQSFTEF